MYTYVHTLSRHGAAPMWVAAQPPRGVRARRLRDALGQQDPYRRDQRLAQRRPGEHRQRPWPRVVVDEVQVADGEEFGGDGRDRGVGQGVERSEEHTSELQSLMRTSYAVFCLKKKN